MNNPASLIIADHVTFSYGSHVALDSVSLAVPEGAYVGVVGPNGGGKTTLVKLLLGLIHPTAGDLQIFGESPSQARKRGRIGYVPQRIAQANFPFPATVEEVVRTGRTAILGIGKTFSTEDYEAVQKALELAGVSDLRGRMMSNLSGGERQKVFIARALATQPKLLILDEPTTGVDIASREQFYALLKSLNARGLTIMLVSHDIEVMTKEASFVLALNQKLICHCSAHDVLSEDVLKQLYGHDVEELHHHSH